MSGTVVLLTFLTLLLKEDMTGIVSSSLRRLEDTLLGVGLIEVELT